MPVTETRTTEASSAHAPLLGGSGIHYYLSPPLALELTNAGALELTDGNEEEETLGFKLGHVHLKTRDPARTAHFYMDNLGAALVDTTHGGTSWRLDLDGLRLHVSGFIESQKREQCYGIEHLSLETDHFDETVDNMVRDGGRLLEQFTASIEGRDRRVAFVEGPDGIQLELVER